MPKAIVGGASSRAVVVNARARGTRPKALRNLTSTSRVAVAALSLAALQCGTSDTSLVSAAPSPDLAAHATPGTAPSPAPGQQTVEIAGAHQSQDPAVPSTGEDISTTPVDARDQAQSGSSTPEQTAVHEPTPDEPTANESLPEA